MQHRPARHRRHPRDHSISQKQGIGILIADHNVRETLGITDRAYILSGRPDELIADPEVRRLYLGERFSL